MQITINELLPLIKSLTREDVSGISLNTNIKNDLGLSSMQILRLISLLEKTFNINFEFEDYDSINFQTVGNVVDLIEKRLTK